MKKTLFILIALGVAGLLFPATAQMATNAPDENSSVAAPDQAPPPPDEASPPADAGGEQPPELNDPSPGTPAMRSSSGSTAILPTKAFGTNQVLPSDFMPPTSGGTNFDDLRLNFRNAPLDMVLNYLSDAAGFIIMLDTPVHGNVSVISSQPMNRDAAVDLLNSVLNQNGYAAIRNGRILTILNKNDAKTRNIPVKIGNDPATIPNNDEIVTQIIPIRFVDAGDLVKDLSPFVSPQATVVANDQGNSIVITDTQSNIRHLMEIIKAIDNSAEAETEIRVFRLRYANPTDVATELGSVFPSSTSGSQAPVNFRGGPGGFFQRMMAAQNNNSSSNERIKKATQVTAVADARIQAVIVTAPKDMMDQIAEMMKDLDVASDRDQHVYVYQLKNADPQQVATVLQNMFQSSSSTRGTTTSTTQNSPLQQRAITSSTTTSSTTSTTSGNSGSSGGIGGGSRIR